MKYAIFLAFVAVASAVAPVPIRLPSAALPVVQKVDFMMPVVPREWAREPSAEVVKVVESAAEGIVKPTQEKREFVRVAEVPAIPLVLPASIPAIPLQPAKPKETVRIVEIPAIPLELPSSIPAIPLQPAERVKIVESAAGTIVEPTQEKREFVKVAEVPATPLELPSSIPAIPLQPAQPKETVRVVNL